MFSIMAFMFLFFVGFIALFLYLAWRMDQNTKMLKDEHAQLRVLLRAVESRLDHLDLLETRAARGDEAETPLPEEDKPAGHDPLLHLSFERAPESAPVRDPALELNLDGDGNRR